MLESLYGLPGKIKTLLDRLTAARAGYLDSINPAGTGWNSTRAGYVDRLDAAVSTRAPASTALSTATWTATRAGYLDNLNATVSSRADGSIWTSTRAGYVDRIDTTVSSRADGSIWNSTRAGYIDTMIGRIDASISSRSTLTANDVWGAGTRTVTGIPTVINSIQRGAVTFSSESSGNITISSVDLSKSMLVISCRSGRSDDYAYPTGSGWVSTNVAGGYLSSSTNIAWSSGSLYNTSYSDGTMYWQVIEFK